MNNVIYTQNQCATLREDISRKHLELQDLREDLVAFKSSYDRTKVKRDEYEVIQYSSALCAH